MGWQVEGSGLSQRLAKEDRQTSRRGEVWEQATSGARRSAVGSQPLDEANAALALRVSLGARVGRRQLGGGDTREAQSRDG